MKQDSARFAFKVDKKGRALISSDIRKQLGLKYNSKILVRIDSLVFETNIDERGRFIIPYRMRKQLNSNSGYIFRNGRDGVKVNMAACGAVVPGASPGRGPQSEVIE